MNLWGNSKRMPQTLEQSKYWEIQTLYDHFLAEEDVDEI
jgi:hypothetical protein